MGEFAVMVSMMVVGGLAGLAVGWVRRRALEAELAEAREVLLATKDRLQEVWAGAAETLAAKNEALNDRWVWSENGLFLTDEQEGE